MPAADIPDEFELPDELLAEPDALLLHGGSAVIAPDGEYLVEPVYGEEAIVYADLDLNRIIEEQMTLDVTGHYARDDIFTFEVNRAPAEIDLFIRKNIVWCNYAILVSLRESFVYELSPVE